MRVLVIFPDFSPFFGVLVIFQNFGSACELLPGFAGIAAPIHVSPRHNSAVLLFDRECPVSGGQLLHAACKLRPDGTESEQID